jgi:hypothetical protein
MTDVPKFGVIPIASWIEKAAPYFINTLWVITVIAAFSIAYCVAWKPFLKHKIEESHKPIRTSIAAGFVMIFVFTFLMLIVGTGFYKTIFHGSKSAIAVGNGGVKLTQIFLRDAVIPKLSGIAQWVADEKGLRFVSVMAEKQREEAAFSDTVNSIASIPNDTLNLPGNNLCVEALRVAVDAYKVPLGIVASIMKLESNFRSDATNKNTNGSTDYGCMQINSAAHPTFMQDGKWDRASYNVVFGVKFLRQKFTECGGWECAVKNYNSKNTDKHARYMALFLQAAKDIGASGNIKQAFNSN